MARDNGSVAMAASPEAVRRERSLGRRSAVPGREGCFNFRADQADRPKARPGRLRFGVPV